MSHVVINVGFSRKQVLIGLGSLILSIALAAVAISLIRQQSALGPITDDITDFKPYFFGRDLPAGYTFDRSKVTYSAGVLMVPLTKSGSSGVVLTQQAMSSKLSEKELLQNGDPVEGALHPASVNSVEDRQVGVMVASSDKTLILINAEAATSKGDIASLLKALRPIR